MPPENQMEPPAELEDLQRRLRVLNIAVENSLDSIIIHTLDGRVLFFNGPAAEAQGLTREEFAALPPWGFSGRYTEEERAERLARIRDAGTSVFQSRRLIHGETRVTEVHASYVEGTDLDEPVIVSVSHDVTEQVRAQEILKHRAFHDALTGLANRALFEDRLELAMAGATRHRHVLGLAYLDVDDFKDVNDRYGHEIGDRVLVALGERLERNVRQVDTVARYGGDEFVVVFPELAHATHLESVIAKLQSNLDQPIVLEDLTLTVTSSIGAAIFDPIKDDARSLIMRADIAMYEAKRRRSVDKRPTP